MDVIKHEKNRSETLASSMNKRAIATWYLPPATKSQERSIDEANKKWIVSFRNDAKDLLSKHKYSSFFDILSK